MRSSSPCESNVDLPSLGIIDRLNLVKTVKSGLTSPTGVYLDAKVSFSSQMRKLSARKHFLQCFGESNLD